MIACTLQRRERWGAGIWGEKVSKMQLKVSEEKSVFFARKAKKKKQKQHTYLRRNTRQEERSAPASAATQRWTSEPWQPDIEG